MTHRSSLPISAAFVVVIVLFAGFVAYTWSMSLSNSSSLSSQNAGLNRQLSSLDSQVSSLNQEVSNLSLQVSSSEQTSLIGLRLGAVFNTTQIASGQSIQLNVSDYNLLPKDNNLSISGSSFPLENLGNIWAGSLGPCEFILPLGVAVFQGYFTLANISSAPHPLDLYAPGMYECPEVFGIGYYLFEPLSVNATLLDLNGAPILSGPNTPLNLQMADTIVLGHYWDSSGAEHVFPASWYTVAVGDDWGDLLIVHFDVTT
jgi:hypothetical protein